MVNLSDIIKRLSEIFSAGQPEPRAAQAEPSRDEDHPPPLVAGRPTQAAGGYGPGGLLDKYALLTRRWTPLETLKKIRDYNADAALALWNVMRLANPGHELEVTFSTGNRKGQPDEEGKALLEGLARRVGTEYGGGLDMLVTMMPLVGMTQGAIAAEVELSEKLNDVVDYVMVDPGQIGFARNEDSKWAPVLAGLGKQQFLNTNQFFYLPIDPDVDDPRGRSPLWPALRSAVFQMEVLDDLKKVAHNQGWPRIDVTVLREFAMQRSPAYLREGPPGEGAEAAKVREDKLRAWLKAELNLVKTQYDAMNPDDAFIHWDGIEAAFKGPGQAGSLNLTVLIRALDTQVISSLKQLPILLGRNEAATTTHASIQWQIYVAGIEALQRPMKRLMEQMHNLALQIYGRQSRAKITFNKIRTVDRESEARAELTEVRTGILKVLAGWWDNDEAAQAVVGHEAVGEMSVVLTEGEMRMLAGELEQRQMGPPDPSGGSELALITRTPAWMRNAYRRTMETYQVLDRTWVMRAQEEIKALRGDGQGGGRSE